MSDTQARPNTRRRMFQALGAGISMLGLTPLLNACGQNAPPTQGVTAIAVPEAPVSTPSAQQTITVWYYDGSIDSTVHAFEEAHPAIGVDLRTFGDADQGLMRTLQSGSGGPDVSVFFSGNAGAIAEGGGLADLAAAPFDAASLKGNIVESAWQTGLDAQGRLIGLPLSIYPSTYWYRADLLAEAGVESEPEKLQERIKDWAALFTFAQEYQAKRPDSSLLPRAFADVFLPQLLQQGGGLIENSKLMLTEKATAPAQQALRTRTLKLDLDLVEGGADWDEAIRTGRIAGLFAPSWFQGYISEIYSNLVGSWRTIPSPGVPYLQGAQYLGIPSTSTKQELAWSFVRYCCAEAAGQNTFLSASGDFPALRTAWTDPLYDAPVGFFGGQRVYRQWATIADSAQMMATSPYDADVFDKLFVAVRKVIDGEIEAEPAMQAAEDQLIKAHPGLIL